MLKVKIYILEINHISVYILEINHISVYILEINHISKDSLCVFLVDF